MSSGLPGTCCSISSGQYLGILLLTSSPDIHSVVTSYKGARLAIKHFNHFKLLNVCVVFAQFKVGSCVPIIVDKQFSCSRKFREAVKCQQMKLIDDLTKLLDVRFNDCFATFLEFRCKACSIFPQ